MPVNDENGQRSGRPIRDPETRGRDHDQIDRLTDELLPDLIDRLAASGLGEIEVREDDWRIRLRLPAAAAAGITPATSADRPADRTATARFPAADGAALAGTRPLTATAPWTAAANNGTGPTPGIPAGPHRVIAISPAVGIFQPRPEIRAGARVRHGDRLGTVDLLGVPQDVVSPEDGVVVDTLAQSGEGVEYAQDLVVIEPGRGRHGVDGAAGAAALDQPLAES